MIENPYFFQVGGSLPADAKTYVYRTADDELVKAIKDNKFSYLLAPRQVGKTSLKVRTIKQLEKENYSCISLDLSSIGTHDITTEQWYYTLIYYFSRGIDKASEVRQWWQKNHTLEHDKLLLAYFEHFLLANTEKPIVIFIDEIESIIKLSKKIFDKNLFFHSIKQCYDLRNKRNIFNRLNFVIIGVAHHTELCSNDLYSPFYDAREITLESLDFEKSSVLTEGFSHLNVDLKKLLAEIFKCTGGQPFLTQKLCKSLAMNEQELISIEGIVNMHVDLLFLKNKNGDVDCNIDNIASRLLNDKKHKFKMLAFWKKLLSGEKILFDKTDINQQYLLLTGVVRVKPIEENNVVSDYIIPYNTIYLNKFDSDWLKRYF